MSVSEKVVCWLLIALLVAGWAAAVEWPHRRFVARIRGVLGEPDLSEPTASAGTSATDGRSGSPSKQRVFEGPH